MDFSINFQLHKDVGKQLSASVASHLREKIISGKLKTGDFLRIQLIAKELGISTTPVREGLLLLQSESFVRLLPRRGFMVNSFNLGDLNDIFWAQAVIGAELAGRAAQKMSKKDHAHLQQLISEHQKSYEDGDEDAVARIGHQFHRAINIAADSPRLAMLLDSLTKKLPNQFYASIEGHLELTLQYHPIILDAIRLKDSDAVRSLMYKHILGGCEHLVESLKLSGSWIPPKETASAPTGKALAKTASKAKPINIKKKSTNVKDKPTIAKPKSQSAPLALVLPTPATAKTVR